MKTARYERSYTKEADLLKAYRKAQNRAEYLSDVDDKLLSYGNVIAFCAASKKCLQKESTKRNQILFWTYHHIGDLFLKKNLERFEPSNNAFALEAYQNALELSKTTGEQTDTLKKMRDVYLLLEDENGYFQTSAEMARLVDDALKAQAFLELAQNATSAKQEAYFLEQALKFVNKEDISFLQKCRQTVVLCERLYEIYQKIGDFNKALEFKNIEQQTERLIN
ncbi:MAG: hypothetical protein IJ870_04835 [Alphaproteobacteria bacterium]|nr:hypothetical protein [Alphaproteobacteria bacterium]